MANGRETTIKGEDDLRLWLSLRCIQGDNKTDGGEAIVSVFAAITSACMRPIRGAEWLNGCGFRRQPYGMGSPTIHR